MILIELNFITIFDGFLIASKYPLDRVDDLFFDNPNGSLTENPAKERFTFVIKNNDVSIGHFYIECLESHSYFARDINLYASEIQAQPLIVIPSENSYYSINTSSISLLDNQYGVLTQMGYNEPNLSAACSNRNRKHDWQDSFVVTCKDNSVKGSTKHKQDDQGNSSTESSIEYHRKDNNWDLGAKATEKRHKNNNGKSKREVEVEASFEIEF